MADLQAFINQYGDNPNGTKVGYNGFVGECLSLVKLWVDVVAGKKVAPPSGTNSGDGYYSNFPAPLSDYFDKQPWVYGKTYPEGSLVTYAPTHHIAILRSSGAVATVYEQNADPDHSAPHMAQRNNDRIDGILVLKQGDTMSNLVDRNGAIDLLSLSNLSPTQTEDAIKSIVGQPYPDAVRAQLKNGEHLAIIDKLNQASSNNATVLKPGTYKVN